MNYLDLKNYLSSKLKRNISYAEIAQSIGLDRSSISLYVKGNKEVRSTHKEKLEEFYEIKISDNELFDGSNTEYIDAKLYPDVFGSCGNGVFEQSQNFERVKIPTYMINNRYNKNKEYSVIKAKGNSMTGSIEDGDKLLVESFDAEKIIDNEIYIFIYNNELFIKRLIKNVDQIIIKSDNKDIPTRYIEGENINNFCIKGRVIGLVRSYLKESDF